MKSTFNFKEEFPDYWREVQREKMKKATTAAMIYTVSVVINLAIFALLMTGIEDISGPAFVITMFWVSITTPFAVSAITKWVRA